jgi:hypothetical protein
MYVEYKIEILKNSIPVINSNYSYNTRVINLFLLKMVSLVNKVLIAYALNT